MSLLVECQIIVRTINCANGRNKTLSFTEKLVYFLFIIWISYATLIFCDILLDTLFVGVFRSSHPEVFYKKGVIKNLAKFTGKHLCWSIFFKKVSGHSPATLLKKRLQHRCFPMSFAKFLTAPFFIDNLLWLLLRFATKIIQNVSLERRLEFFSIIKSPVTHLFYIAGNTLDINKNQIIKIIL